ncbi:MAG: histidine kinase [Candidatus Acidiferrum sp.]
MKTRKIVAAPLRWYWIAAIWGGMGLFDATQTVVTMRSEGMHHAWVKLFFALLLSWLPWVLATPLILRLGRRYPLVQVRSFTTWLRHAGAWAGLSVVSAGWTAVLEALLNPWSPMWESGPFLPLWQKTIYNQLLSSVILYGCIVLVGWMLDSRERLARQQMEAARLSEQLTKAQLNALRHQIEPHFLFNTLNAISGLVREGRNDAAVGMIAGLSEFLRHVLKDSGRQEVALGEELGFVEKYLEIQKARFAERLQVRMDVAKELGGARVPSLILQPIVENAVKHGIAKRAQGGAIEISAARVNGKLTLSVYNDGPGLPADWEGKREAIGLSNVRERLQSLYGDGCELKMANSGGHGVKVTISVPYAEEVKEVKEGKEVKEETEKNKEVEKWKSKTVEE